MHGVKLLKTPSVSEYKLGLGGADVVAGFVPWLVFGRLPLTGWVRIRAGRRCRAPVHDKDDLDPTFDGPVEDEVIGNWSIRQTRSPVRRGLADSAARHARHADECLEN